MARYDRRDVLKRTGSMVLAGGAFATGGAVTAAGNPSRGFSAPPEMGASTGWTSAQGNAGNTSALEDGPELDGDELGTAWTYERLNSSVAVSDDTLYTGFYTGSEEGIVALDIEDGTVAWRNEDIDGGWTPVVADDTVYVQRREGIVALDRSDGTSRWETDVGSAPTVAYGSVYVTEDETLYALDADDGSVQWEVEMDGDTSLTGSLAAANDRIYAVTECSVRLFDPASGDEEGEVDRECSSASSIAVSSAAVAVASDTESYRIYDVNSDEEIATVDGHSIALDDDVAVVRHRSNGLTAIDLGSGDKRWDTSGKSSRPVIVGDVVYYYSPEESGSLVAIDKGDGTTNWEFELDIANDHPSIAVSGETIYVSDEGQLLAIRETAGEAESEDGGSDSDGSGDSDDDGGDGESGGGDGGSGDGESGGSNGGSGGGSDGEGSGDGGTGGSGGSGNGGNETNESDDDVTIEVDGDSVPGFGVVTSLAGAAGGVALAARRMLSDGDESQARD